MALIGAAALVFALSACAEQSELPETPAGGEVTEEPTQTEEPQAPEQPAGDGDYTAADWAYPVEAKGEHLLTIDAGQYEVEVYQVGVVEATKNGNFVGQDNQPLIAVGSDIVYLQYIVTNTSGEDIKLSYSLASVNAHRDDNPYVQEDSITDFALETELGIREAGIQPGSGSAPFVWPSGTSFTATQNLNYTQGAALTITTRLTPVNDEGDLLHDLRAEQKTAVTLK